jgi:hypothetical protein
MGHDDFVFGWREEANVGVRDLAGTPADTQIYQFGILIGDTFEIPYPVPQPWESWVYSSWEPNAHGQKGIYVPHTFQFITLNGLEAYFALGNFSNSVPNSYELHEGESLDAGHLPTRTFHYEAKGGTAELYADFVGRKNVVTEWSCTRGSFMINTVTTLGCKGGTSKQAIFDNTLAGASAAVEFTNAPILPPTANVEPYCMDANFTCTWNNHAANPIHQWKCQVAIPTTEVRIDSNTADDFGIAQKRWPWYNWENGKLHAVFTLLVEQNDRYTWDDMLDALATRTFETKFARSTHDFMKFTGANSQITTQKIFMPSSTAPGLFHIYIKPKTLTIDVEDNIDADGAPNFYGG